MQTQRRTLRTPPAKAARKLFKTVPQYLAWVRNAAPDLQAPQCEEPPRALLRQLAARILIRARADDTHFRQLFHVPDGFPKRFATKKMMVVNRAGEYTLRLPLVHNGPLRTFQMLVGPSHGVKQGEALLRLHEALTREQKTVQRHALSSVIDDHDYLSHNRIGAWLAPLLKKVIRSIDKTETKQFHVAAQTVFTKKGLAALMTLSPKADNDDHVITMVLRFEVTVCLHELPWNFRLRQPYPRHAPRPGRPAASLGRDIKQAFERGQLAVYLRCPVHKPTSLPDISMLPTRAKTYLEYSVKRCGTAFTSQSLPESFSQLNLGEDHGDPRAWRLDYIDIEKFLFTSVSPEPRFRTIDHALDLYDIIATYGNKIVPRLNKKTRRALSLWLFRRGDQTLDTIYGAFQDILEIVNDCIKNEFFPSFCQPQENTLDEDMEGYLEVLNKRIEWHREEWEREDDGSGSEEEHPYDGLNNIELLLRAIREDCVKDAINLINIC